MDEKKLYRLISFLRTSQNRVKILRYLTKQESPQTPSDIKDATGLYLSHVSNQLTRLREEDLVELLTPDAAQNRFYKITDRGQEVLSEMPDEEADNDENKADK
jgi:DNA-binding MarR family transcriptional regulator